MLSKKIYFVHFILIVFLFISIQKTYAMQREAAYLQTDREVYIAGESVFYKLCMIQPETKLTSELSKIGYIVLRNTQSNHVLQLRVAIDKGVSIGSFLLPDTLSSGVYQLIAFSNLMRNYSENSFFRKNLIIANRHDKEFNFREVNNVKIAPDTTNLNRFDLFTDKQEYGTREKVILNLGKDKGHLAVTVYEDPQMTLSNKNITESLADFIPYTIDRNKMDFLVENRGKVIRGKVINIETQKPIQHVVVLLSCLDSIANLQYQTTDENGCFQMLLSDYYDGKELFFVVKGGSVNEKYKIELEDKFILNQDWKPLLSGVNNFQNFIARSAQLVYINNCYNLESSLSTSYLNKENEICPKVYNCDVSTVYPADYVSLKDFPEIVVELLPKARIINHNNKYSIHLINSAISSPFQKEPAIFLDGVFVDDINKIIGMGSDKIARIDLVDTERVFGDIVFQGIISITTKSKEVLRLTPSLGGLRIKNDTVNTGKKFTLINPVGIPGKTTPYFRQLLYWNPDVFCGKTNTIVEFFTSDHVATFIIKVEGLTEEGKPVFETKRIKVINKNNSVVK